MSNISNEIKDFFGKVNSFFSSKLTLLKMKLHYKPKENSEAVVVREPVLVVESVIIEPVVEPVVGPVNIEPIVNSVPVLDSFIEPIYVLEPLKESLPVEEPTPVVSSEDELKYITSYVNGAIKNPISNLD